jgi:hypothetical protein
VLLAAFLKDDTRRTDKTAPSHKHLNQGGVNLMPSLTIPSDTPSQMALREGMRFENVSETVRDATKLLLRDRLLFRACFYLIEAITVRWKGDHRGLAGERIRLRSLQFEDERR